MERKVEVCIAVWNERDRIGRVLDALAGQSMKDFRVSVFDNDSEDETVDICNAYRDRLDLTVHSKTRNLGQTVNINRSFINARSRYVALLSGNDVVSSDYLEALVSVLDEDPRVGTAYARAELVDEDGWVLREQPPGWDFFSARQEDPVERACSVIERYCQATHFFAMYRREILDRMLPKPFCYGGDHIFASEAALYGHLVCVDQARVLRSQPPGWGKPGERVVHLMKLFSRDRQRSVPDNSKLTAFEMQTPHVDMLFGHLDMFRLADLPLENRSDLATRGVKTFLHRFGRAASGDVQRIIPVARRVAEIATTNDVLTRLMVYHALRKVDQCLYLKQDRELFEVRKQLSARYIEDAHLGRMSSEEFGGAA